MHAVLTHADVPGAKTYGLEFADQPVLASDRVRYHGEPVAIVAAQSLEQARAAARAIAVVYEALPPVDDMQAATSMPAIHEAPDERPRLSRRSAPERRAQRRHPPRRSRRPGEVVVTGEYEVGIQDQAFLGPESGLAVPDGEGGVDIYVATQWLHVDRDQVAPCSGSPPSRCASTWPASAAPSAGARISRCRFTARCSALHTGRAVRVVYGRAESFVGHVHRHPARMRFEHRAPRDGRITSCTARSCSTAAPTRRARPRSSPTPALSRSAPTTSRTR